MIATAQAGIWEGRIEQLGTRQDDGRQYCARHAAMLRKENEREKKNNEEQFLEKKKFSTPAKVSVS